MADIEELIEKELRERHNEKMPRISLRMVQRAPWLALNIPQEMWYCLATETKKQLQQDAYDILHKQLLVAVKGAKTIEEVRRCLSKVMKREPSKHTVLAVAGWLGIKGAISEGWKLYGAKIAELCKGAKTIEEVRRCLSKVMKREPSKHTVLNVAAMLGIKEAVKEGWGITKARWKVANIKIVAEKLIKGENIALTPTDSETIIAAGKEYVAILRKKGLDNKKIKKILQERGVIEEHMEVIMK